MADKDDDFHDRVAEMADELGLEGKDRSKYIHEHMTRKGYEAVPQYVMRGDDDDQEESSGFFGGRGRRSSSRDRDRGRGRSRRDDEGDDWYS